MLNELVPPYAPKLHNGVFFPAKTLYLHCDSCRKDDGPTVTLPKWEEKNQGYWSHARYCRECIAKALACFPVKGSGGGFDTGIG